MAPDHPAGGDRDRLAKRHRRRGADRLGVGGASRVLRFRQHGEPFGRRRGGPDRFLRGGPAHEGDRPLHRRGEGRAEIPLRRPRLPEAGRDLQGRADRAGAQGGGVAHPVARGPRRDLRRRVPPERRAPRRHARGAVRLREGPRLRPAPRGSANADRHELRRVRDHRHRRGRGGRAARRPAFHGALREAPGDPPLPLHRRQPPRSHRGHRRRPLPERARRGRGGVRRGDDDLRGPDPRCLRSDPPRAVRAGVLPRRRRRGARGTAAVPREEDRRLPHAGAGREGPLLPRPVSPRPLPALRGRGGARGGGVGERR